MIPAVCFALLVSFWILALYLGSQAAIAGAVVMTLACLGVLVIYSILVRSQDRY
ncbi:hypothetical protein [Fluviibacter phosphoraccumulans]|uniref:hypothetical protein n=1 Tax=Fluviibacter phosphoraccumulans TaxID=1751046 RepID=UPI001389C8D0|nr:hypothetical protein [Fluviibacter phosphoraccumulans]